MVKPNNYPLMQHGLLTKENKDPLISFPPSPDKYEYFDLYFLYDGWKQRKLKGVLFSITEGPCERYYARVNLQSGSEPWSIQLDLTPRLVDTVLFHLKVCRRELEHSKWEYMDPRFFMELTDYVEQSIREKFGVPRPEGPTYQSKSNVIPFRKK